MTPRRERDIPHPVHRPREGQQRGGTSNHRTATLAASIRAWKGPRGPSSRRFAARGSIDRARRHHLRFRRLDRNGHDERGRRHRLDCRWHRGERGPDHGRCGGLRRRYDVHDRHRRGQRQHGRGGTDDRPERRPVCTRRERRGNGQLGDRVHDRPQHRHAGPADNHGRARERQLCVRFARRQPER